jgi:hypothetical protein
MAVAEVTLEIEQLDNPYALRKSNDLQKHSAVCE